MTELVFANTLNLIPDQDRQTLFLLLPCKVLYEHPGLRLNSDFSGLLTLLTIS